MITVKTQLEQWASAKLPEYLKNELDEIRTDERLVEDHFYQNVKFGTGGMRGVLGVGTNRMNIYTVRRAAAGLAQYVCEGGEEAKTRGVVIAYDTRHFSKEFAVETAKVLGAYGVHSYVFSESRPTPELSFAVRYLYAYAGLSLRQAIIRNSTTVLKYTVRTVRSLYLQEQIRLFLIWKKLKIFLRLKQWNLNSTVNIF